MDAATMTPEAKPVSPRYTRSPQALLQKKDAGGAQGGAEKRDE